MTIGDLIKNKDYDYVSYRLTLPDGDDAFAGCFASKDSEIIPLDGIVYLTSSYNCTLMNSNAAV